VYRYGADRLAYFYLGARPTSVSEPTATTASGS